MQEKIDSKNTLCSHCKQEYTESTLIKVENSGENLYFCCNGCKLTYFLLKENNLESFYAKLGDKKLQTKSMQENAKQNLNYNSINFQQKYIKQNGEYKEVFFIIEGIVCAACVWLNEQILNKLDGIEDIQINYTTHKAKVIFNDKIISLEKIIQAVQSIGYNAIIYDPKEKEAKHFKRNRIYYVKLVVAIFCTMNVMWINVGQYTGFFFGLSTTASNILNLASFILTTPVLFFCASSFYSHTFKGLKHGILGMEALVISGTSLVYFYSIYAWLSNSGHTYFESVCMIILFVLGAKFLESISRQNANDNLDRLNSILPIEARLENGKIISVYDVKQNDKLLVLPGEMVSNDGILDSEFGEFNYSNISGESLSISKKSGDSIMAGALCLNSPIVYVASSEFEDSSISKLAKLLKDSEFSQPKIATLAFRIAGVFSKIVLSIAALGFLYHYFIGHSSFEESLLICVSVIVIACPCALALATPIASVVGLNVGFKNKVIYTKAQFLESLANVKYVFFDKTGTLTDGNLRVEKIEKINEIKDENSDKEIIKSLMKKNPHLIAKAIINHFENIQDSNLEVKQFNIMPGRGFGASIDNIKILAGSEDLLKEQNIDLNENNQDSYTRFYIAFENNGKYELAYIFYLQDNIKEGANNLIKELEKNKKEVIIISGDRESSVKLVANSLNINKIYHSQTPLQKADIIESLIDRGEKVAMIGDGLNDSLSLKYAQVGISMGSGSEISLMYSNVIILDDKLQTLQKAFIIADKTLSRIKQNLTISLVYNTIALPFALCGFVIPLFAAAFMSLSSLCVVLNSLRLYKEL